jgi:hypothetical protein
MYDPVARKFFRQEIIFIALYTGSRAFRNCSVYRTA